MGTNSGENNRTDAVEAPNKKRRKVKRPTRFIFKLLGLLLLCLAGYVGFYMYRHNVKLEDLKRQDMREKIAGALGRDLKKAAETAKPYARKGLEKAREYLYSVADLKKMIKGKPPETKAEQIALVEQAEKVTKEEAEADRIAARAAEEAVAKGKTEGGTPVQPKTEVRRENNAWAMAKRKYREASAAFAKSHPLRASHADRQKYIRVAEPLYEECLKYCAQARKAGVSAALIDPLEQNAARCLYTCKKTQELGHGY